MNRKLLSPARIGIGLLASVGLGWLAAHGLDWAQVGDSLARVSPSLVILSLAIFMLGSYLRAFRWRILFVNDRISTSRLFVIQNVGIGLNNVLPIRVASEAAQLAILTLRDRINPSTALATLGMERIIDLVASTFILAVAFFFVPEMQNFTLYVWGALGFALVCVALVRLLSWGSHRFGAIDRFPFLASFASAVRELEQHKGRLAMSLALSTVYWLLVGVTAWLLARSISLSITPMTATLVIMGTIFFATAVPAAPSAIGAFEFAVVYVLEFFGVSREAGFGFAVVAHAVFFLPPTIMAAIFLPREGMTSVGRVRELISARRATQDADAA
jgi:uncharacterized membrane protein YbhN (UPF0104 family)